MKYKNRTEQQKIDPYDIPVTNVDVGDSVYVDEVDNITEEIELTLEKAVDMTETLREKIWKKHRSKNAG
jgi:hypothetical protein